MKSKKFYKFGFWCKSFIMITYENETTILTKIITYIIPYNVPLPEFISDPDYYTTVVPSTVLSL